MSGVSISDYQQIVAELAEQIKKYGDARSAHDKSADTLNDLGTQFNKSAMALGVQINNTVSSLENVNAAVSASNTRAVELQGSMERSAASQVEALDRLSARADDLQKSAEIRIQEISSRLDILNTRVSQVLFLLYGVVTLLIVVLLMVILR